MRTGNLKEYLEIKHNLQKEDLKVALVECKHCEEKIADAIIEQDGEAIINKYNDLLMENWLSCMERAIDYVRRKNEQT